jgi:hypothetical protein
MATIHFNFVKEPWMTNSQLRICHVLGYIPLYSTVESGALEKLNSLNFFEIR